MSIMASDPKTIEDIAKNLGQGDQADIDMLDFTEALDKVQHRRLHLEIFNMKSAVPC